MTYDPVLNFEDGIMLELTQVERFKSYERIRAIRLIPQPPEENAVPVESSLLEVLLLWDGVPVPCEIEVKS